MRKREVSEDYNKSIFRQNALIMEDRTLKKKTQKRHMHCDVRLE